MSDVTAIGPCHCRRAVIVKNCGYETDKMDDWGLHTRTWCIPNDYYDAPSVQELLDADVTGSGVIMSDEFFDDSTMDAAKGER